VARRQRDAERGDTLPTGGGEPTTTRGTGGTPDVGQDRTTAGAPPGPALRRFYAVKDLDATKAGLEASQIAREVIAHLAGLPGAEVRVTLEIQATFREEVPEHVMRTITENCRALKFTRHEFAPE